ncbi:sxtJ, partial [Achromatium sp. WMS1]
MYIEIPDTKGLREFGLVTGSMFIGIFGLLLPWLLRVTIPVWPWIIAGILWSLALLIPNRLKWIYYGWMLVA